ncbi:hypothetical protein EDC96DRAFT_478330 [Choanephora cucurbitarum]|nr:hypothetical protein EDC96DRAFT_478330 [Choanephora cucurbitarum]
MMTSIKQKKSLFWKCAAAAAFFIAILLLAYSPSSGYTNSYQPIEGIDYFYLG